MNALQNCKKIIISLLNQRYGLDVDVLESKDHISINSDFIKQGLSTKPNLNITIFDSGLLLIAITFNDVKTWNADSYKVMDAFNANVPFLKMYLDEDNVPTIEYASNVASESTLENIIDCVIKVLAESETTQYLLYLDSLSK